MIRYFLLSVSLHNLLYKLYSIEANCFPLGPRRRAPKEAHREYSSTRETRDTELRLRLLYPVLYVNGLYYVQVIMCYLLR